MLTPGGHRRFAAADVDQLTHRRHAIRKFGPVERIWATHAMELTRKAIMERGSQAGLRDYDDAERAQHREMGQQLMRITAEYITAAVEDDGLLARAREIGQLYGQYAQTHGSGLTEALRASMFFRDTLVASALELPENVRIPAASQKRMLERINTVINEVQLGVADLFDAKSDTR